MNKALISNIVEVLRNLNYITSFENLPFWFAISKELRLSNQKTLFDIKTADLSDLKKEVIKQYNIYKND